MRFFYLLISFFILNSSNQDYAKLESQNLVDPPFICIAPCLLKEGLRSKQETNKIELVFSGYNSENGFLGYNIWYGKKEDIINAYGQQDYKNFLLVHELVYNVNSEEVADNIVFDVAKQSELKSRQNYRLILPSYRTTKTTSRVTPIQLEILNAEAGNSIFVTAYLIDRSESYLSNEYKIE